MSLGRSPDAISYYRRSPAVASRIVDGQALLLKRPESRAFILNQAASRIWVRADGTRSEADLAGERDARVLRPFFDKMVEVGLLERADGPLEADEAFPQDVEWHAPGPELELPAICASEVIQIIAGLCDSNWGGNSGCYVSGLCSVPIN